MSTVITDNLYHGSGKVNMIMLNGERIYQGVTKPAPEPEYDKMYLTIEALSGGTFYIRNADVSYSVNESEWETTTGETALVLNTGDKARFKGTTGGRYLFYNNNSFNFKAYGNIESLEYGDNFVGKTNINNFESFRAIFDSCSIVSSINLILPATNLGGGCYEGMFYNCTSLIDTPILPATTLMNFCYNSMFWGCSKVKYIKCLATSSLDAQSCLDYWVNGVSPTGTFVKKAGVSWPTGANGIPSGWTVIEE